jgi:hypothetical protein
MTDDKANTKAFLRQSRRQMLTADVFADEMTKYFRGTKHETEARRLARLAADSAVDATHLAHRLKKPNPEAEASKRTERERAEQFVQDHIRDVPGNR